MNNSAFTVRLERVFQGPMDLLLHLVREQEVEIHDIEIHRVIAGYLAYLKALKDLDIELAGDFLVLAATLMSIKSRSLLPREEVDLDEDFDPRDELIQRLIEYRRFKEASDELARRQELRAQLHARGGLGTQIEAEEPVLDLGELTSWDLLGAFSRLMRETLANRPHRITPDRRPLRFYVGELAHKIRAMPKASLRDLFLALDLEPTRESLVCSFCALLELVKLGLVGIVQEERLGDIAICLKPEHEADIESIVQSSIFDDEAEFEAEGAPASEASNPASDAPSRTNEAPSPANEASTSALDDPSSAQAEEASTGGEGSRALHDEHERDSNTTPSVSSNATSSASSNRTSSGR